MNFEEEYIKQTYNFLAHEKETEIRLIDPKEEKKPQSYFVHKEKEFVEVCKRFVGEYNIYAGINERILGGTTSEEVIAVKTVVVDIDPVRINAPLGKKDASNEEELKEAEQVADKIITDLTGLGFQAPIKCLSGNGVQLWFAFPKIELNETNRKETENKVKLFIENLQKKYNTEKVKIDQIGDLARIIKVMGTISIKGSNTIERPYRISKPLNNFERKEDNKFLEELQKLKQTTTEKEPERSIKLTTWEILKLKNPTTKERGSLIMQLKEGKNWSEEQILSHIAQNNNWENYDPIKTREGLKTFFEKYAEKPNPRKQKEAKELLPDVPAKTLVDFNEFIPVFENTNTHLPAYKIIESDVGLKGEEYYPMKKAMCYHVESIRQNPSPYLKGTKALSDNRPHFLIMLTGGAGKGVIKDVGRKYNMGKYSRTIEISGNRLNLEQLVGKIKSYEKNELNEETGKKEKVIVYKEILGYFGYDVVQIDECTELLCETNTTHIATMEEIRKAMDIYGKNWVEKKLVDDEKALTYKPKTKFIFFCHDCILPPVFFDKGTFRRLTTFSVTSPKMNETASVEILFDENYSKKLDNYINKPLNISQYATIEFSKNALEELMLWILTWNRWALLHPNPRIRAVAKRWFVSVREIFLKNCIVLGLTYAEGKTEDKIEIQKDIVTLACFDTIQFLLETYKVYGNKSNVNWSRDAWKTSDQKKARFLEWLHYNGAISLETSKITVTDAVEKIAQDIWGVNDRQAKSILQELSDTDGLINKSQDGEHKKVWLSFEPNLEGNITFETRVQPNLKEFLEKKKAEFETSISFGGALFPTIQRLNAEISKMG